MFADILKDYKLILASSSPRRQEMFKLMGIPFEVRLKPVEEEYPSHLKGHEISDYLAQLKAAAFQGLIAQNEIIITSDTVVWHKGRSLAKAANEEKAFEMIRTLNNDTHEVITSVCFTTTENQVIKNSNTEVTLGHLSDEEIRYYIKTCRPFDKAGAYGIQEWIGLVGIMCIKGSYTNVVGLPTQLVYKTLMDMVS